MTGEIAFLKWVKGEAVISLAHKVILFDHNFFTIVMTLRLEELRILVKSVLCQRFVSLRLPARYFEISVKSIILRCVHPLLHIEILSAKSPGRSTGSRPYREAG